MHNKNSSKILGLQLTLCMRSNKKRNTKKGKICSYKHILHMHVLLHINILLVALQRPLYCSTALYYSIALFIGPASCQYFQSFPLTIRHVTFHKSTCRIAQHLGATTHRRATPTDGTDRHFICQLRHVRTLSYLCHIMRQVPTRQT